MKIKLLSVGKYSWDGKSLIVRRQDQVCETVDNKTDELEGLQVHEGVALQWIDQGIAREVKPQAKTTKKKKK